MCPIGLDFKLHTSLLNHWGEKSGNEKKLAELAGNQDYVEKSGHLFVFCADLHRHELIGEMEDKDVTVSLESTEKFMVALIDAALAAQNAALAAESMGLGICYIGGIRNNLEDVSALLKVPDRVIPLFAITVGYPAVDTGKNPDCLYIMFIMRKNMSKTKKYINRGFLNIIK